MESFNNFEQFLANKGEEVAKEEEYLEKAGGVAFETNRNPETGGEKHFVNFFGTRIETAIETQEEFQRVKESINFSELDEKVFTRVAQAYDLKHSIMLEGDPGAGKTFDYSKFHELLEGEGKKPLILTCAPKMSELEIIGHWMPSPGGRMSGDKAVKDAYASFDDVKSQYDIAAEEYHKIAADAKAQRDSEEIDGAEYVTRLETAGRAFEPAQAKFRGEVASLRAETEGQVDWAFKKGALLEAFVGDGGKGRMLVVDEFNLLPSNVQQIFLETVSTGGRLADHIVNTSNSNQTVYERGERGYICYAQNFPEETRGRNIVAAPMTDRVEWYAIPNDLVEEKEIDFISTWNGNLRLKRNPDEKNNTQRITEELRPLAEACDSKIIEVFGRALARFHREYKDLLAKMPDKIDGEERTQDLETSGRRALHTINHIERFYNQGRGKDGKIDFEKILIRAATANYADRIYDQELRQKVINQFNLLITDKTLGQMEFEGKTMTVSEVLVILKGRFAREEYERYLSQIPETEKKNAELDFETEEQKKEISELEIYQHNRVHVMESLASELEEYCALEESK